MGLTRAGIIMAVVIGSAWPQTAFEVASVRPNNTDEHIGYGTYSESGRLVGKNMSAKAWVQIAYQVKAFQVIAPAWASNEKFDIQAKAAGPVASYNQLMLMLQSLLADRFKLRLHREMRESTVYALVIGRDGLKMKPSKDQTLWSGDYPDGAPHGERVAGASPRDFRPGLFVGEAIPINEFIGLIAGPLGRQIINKTGLTGRYDIDLHYNPSDVDQSDKPSLFTAIQEQLGLRLESAKAPVEVLIIDQIERPGDN